MVVIEPNTPLKNKQSNKEGGQERSYESFDDQGIQFFYHSVKINLLMGVANVTFYG